MTSVPAQTSGVCVEGAVRFEYQSAGASFRTLSRRPLHSATTSAQRVVSNYTLSNVRAP